MAQTTPQSVAQTFFTALEKHQWRDATALVDPEQLGPYREETLAMFIAWAQHRDEVREAQRSGGSAMVGWSSEGTVDPKLLSRHGDTPLPVIPGVKTLRDLAALDPSEFMARLFEATSMDALAEFRGGVRMTMRIVGAVRDGDSVAYVLYRPEGADIRYDDPYYAEILPTVRRGGRWYVRRNRMEQNFGSLSMIMMRLDMPDLPGFSPGDPREP